MAAASAKRSRPLRPRRNFEVFGDFRVSGKAFRICGLLGGSGVRIVGVVRLGCRVANWKESPSSFAFRDVEPRTLSVFAEHPALGP